MIYPTTEDFKKNVRKAFNAAEAGEEVVILRMKQKFVLVKVDEDA